jgi:hypothetical protein
MGEGGGVKAIPRIAYSNQKRNSVLIENAGINELERTLKQSLL